MPDLQSLQRLKQVIESTKMEKAQLEGRLAQSLANLKQEFQVGSMEEAAKLLKTLERKKTNLEKEIQQGLQELETQFTW